MSVEDVTKWLTGEWAVIAHAPFTFIAAVAVAAFIIWKIVQREFANRLADANSKLELANARVDDYERKLSGASPDEAKAKLDALEAQLEALMPRRLRCPQKTALQSAIAGRTGTISLVVLGAVPDADRYGDELRGVFQEVGWTVSRMTVMGGGLQSDTGLVVVVLKEGPSAEAVFSGLDSAGVAYEPHSDAIEGMSFAPGADVGMLICYKRD